MKKWLSLLLSAVCFMLGVCFVGCDKTSAIPEGNYGIAKESNVFAYTDGDVRDTYGWVIDGETAELWTGSVCEYKAKIIEKDGEILFDGYRWRDFLDVLLGDKDKRGSNHDYTVVYDEATGSITLTPKLPQENVEYVFDGVTFEKSSGLKIEDLSNYIPLMQAEDIKTVKDFEKLIRDNLDTYTLIVNENGTNKQVYFTPKYHSITLKTGNILSLIEKEGETPQEFSCMTLNSGSRWDYVAENETFRFDSASTFSYTVTFPMEAPNYFRVAYNYRVK